MHCFPSVQQMQASSQDKTRRQDQDHLPPFFVGLEVGAGGSSSVHHMLPCSMPTLSIEV
jgi:hypothetical protein